MLRFALLIALAWAISPVAAFGAGNIASIAKIEGKNWRHGDIEDILLSIAAAHAYNGGKKFSKMMIKQTYFGNWARDYSQAIDVGTVKSVSAEAIRLLLCVLGFMTFGYGSREFEVTADRLGCYRPEEHIDNPKNYADNEDARQYDRRLRGPIDEERELAIDPETGMKNYIANERAGIMTSARLIRKLFGGCIEKGRRYKDSDNPKDLHESLRLLGTGLHCLEDFYAHSNYCELALIEMGEEDIFPHCGRDTQIELEGAKRPVYPIVTGTFGGVDFLHSVTGEVSDKLTQNEIDELEGTLQESSTADTSMLRDLLDKIPDGFFGDKHESDKVEEIQANANNAQMQNMSVSPRDPEEFTEYVQQTYNQVMPAIEFHDEVMQSITSAIEKIPVLPKIVEQLEEELSRFVFSVIAPFVVPLIQNIKSELTTGSDAIIQSSEREQHIVFHDDNSTDPTHSMLSKDHFSNILNEVAGQCAAKMVHWVTPQLMEAIDDENADIDRVLDRIIHGIMHHPAQRDMGEDGAHEGRRRVYQSVKEWWREMGDDQREDYRRKLSRDGVENAENHKEGVYDTGHGHGCVGKLKMQKLYGGPETTEDKIASAAAGVIIEGVSNVFNNGGGNGGGRKKDEGLGGLIGAAGSLLGLGGGDDGGSSRRHDDDDDDDDNRHSESRRQERRRDDDDDDNRHSESRRQEEHRSHSSAYDQGGSHGGPYGGGHAAEYASGGGYGREESSGYGRQESSGYGREESSGYGRQESSGYGREESSGYGRQESSGYGREESSYGHQETSGYGSGGGYGGGGHAAEYASGGGYGSSERQEGGYGGGGGYGDSSYGRQETSYGRPQESSYGGGHASEYASGGGYGSSERQQPGYGGGYGEGGEGYGGSRREEGGYQREHHRRGSGDSDRERDLAYGSGGYNRQGEGGYSRGEYSGGGGGGGGYGGGYREGGGYGY